MFRFPGTVLALALWSPIAFSQQPFFQDGQDPAPAGQAWQPVVELSDDFDGTELDATKWQSNPIGNGWRWDGRAPGLFRAENVSVADGMMQVTVGKLEKPIKRHGETYTHQGAIVRSLHPGQPGQYFECRMKANRTEMSSTFWLMTKGKHAKKLELDIQECVGRTSELTDSWAKNWDQIFHSNAIHRANRNNPDKVQVQASVPTDVKNSDRFFVYGAWWKTPQEIMFFLDGKHTYTIKTPVDYDIPAFIQMAIETYDWNPLPADGGLVESGSRADRTTMYDWVRTWRLEPSRDR
ncbi:glycosyl hydrolase [Crateriforma spongiae]|uniref:glycosyl hydrolase n=1 Tax=Crateriforma spongiae TaxID=2724528 RepID=UPI0039B02E18